MSASIARRSAVLLLGGTVLATGLLLVPTAADAAVIPPVSLGTAGTFTVLGAAEVANTGPSILPADLGVSPGSSLTGWAPPGTVLGATHVTDAVAGQAQLDVTTAANQLMAMPSYDIGTADMNGLTFVAGSYSSASSLLNTGTITLQGDADDVFVFTAVSDLTTGSRSKVAFDGDVQACNVFWRIGSSATLGTNSDFVGTLIAQQAVAATTGATIDGRLFAQVAAVTLDDNVFRGPSCDLSTGDGDTGGGTTSATSAGVAPTRSAVGGVTVVAAGPGTGGLAVTGSEFSWPAAVAAVFALVAGGVLMVSGQRGTGTHRLHRGRRA